MSKYLTGLLAVLLAVAATSVAACPADKAKDTKADSSQTTKPAPRT